MLDIPNFRVSFSHLHSTTVLLMRGVESGGGTPSLEEANKDVPLDGSVFSRLD